jgi:hypothetical protein
MGVPALLASDLLAAVLAAIVLPWVTATAGI